MRTQKKERWLVPAEDKSRGRWLSVLETNPTLFQEFAKVKKNEESIAEFANSYGQLGDEVTFVGAGDRSTSGEPLELWLREIGDMKRLVELWQHMKLNDSDYLKEHFTFTPEHIMVKLDGGSAIVARRGDHDFDDLQGEPFWAALTYMGREINQKLRDHHAAARLMEDRNGDRELSLFITPSSLVSALWFQFALAVSGTRKYKACVECGALFEVGERAKGGKREDSQFCRNEHKAAWHNRQAKLKEEKRKAKRSKNA